jgi:hypothetical protein
MNIVGTISGGASRPLTESRSFVGTSALNDAVVFDAIYQPFPTSPTFRVAFTTIVEDGQGIKYTVFDWPRSNYEAYRLPLLSSPQAIELVSVLSSPVQLLAPGDYRQASPASSTSIIGSAVGGTVYAPTPTATTLGNTLNGGLGNDRLVGSSGNDALVSWSGANTLEGGLGNDLYRIILGHPDNQTINTDTITDVGGFDELSILLVGTPISEILQIRSEGIWWNFKREGNDLLGEFFTFASGTQFRDAELRRDSDETYSFRIQDHFTPSGAVELIRVFGEGEGSAQPRLSFTLSPFAAFPSQTPNTNPSLFAGTDGNDILNLSLSYAAEVSRVNSVPDNTFWVFGNGGDDLFVRPSNAPNIRFFFEGGSGLDTAVYAERLADVTLLNIETQTVLGPRVQIRGSQTPEAVRPDNLYAERVIFSDEALALDTRGNAGQVAKILGAVFGRSFVENKEYAGIGLKLLDDGMSYEALNDLAIKAALGPSPTHAAIVDRLYTNVVGVAPTAPERAFYVNLLDEGMTIGTLGALAADTAINAQNINLTGLYQTGLAYLPSE